MAAPLHPILPFGDAVAGAFQQVDLVEAGVLAKLHDFGAEMTQHGRRTAMFAALLPVAGLLHVGPAFDFAGPQAANDDVNVDISSSIVAVRVGADNGRMTRKILLAKLQDEGLRLFQGQAIVSCIPRIKADDIMVRFYVAGVAILAVLPVRQQAGHSEGVAAAFQCVQQVIFAELGLAVLVQNGQAGVLVVLESEIALRRREVRVLRACMLDGCHTVHRSLSRHPAERK